MFFFIKRAFKRFITEFFGWLADKKIGFITFLAIKLFIKIYKIDMSESRENNLRLYLTFNDFFARSLKIEEREYILEEQHLLQPVDGRVSQIGLIDDTYMLQAKGHFYNLNSLLTNQKHLINKFCNGKFITIYLSPSNYHRVHMPCDGLLKEMIYVPGEFFSVNAFSVKNISNLFARNERLICIFETHIGLMAQILVGSVIVGSINTVWCGCVNTNRNSGIKRWIYPNINFEGSVFLKKGCEMGLFKLGSTVINLFEPNKLIFNSTLTPGFITQVGELLAEPVYVKNVKIVNKLTES
ncbi:Phosphatidylserine decarboxylase proenzyme [Candidatus Providencia siddallii]|uniref:Phosphatidylserine decarboxylase proenzyme n=1 Tax=Candidatus Providencia siddallii TaxID=1715285 RepID=A0A0M6W8B0_9GAMM|nr:Phosphatidylserine decarboxylase proenzyme [Candidatus Providencia siddallii]